MTHKPIKAIDVDAALDALDGLIPAPDRRVGDDTARIRAKQDQLEAEHETLRVAYVNHAVSMSRQINALLDALICLSQTNSEMLERLRA